MSRDLLTIKSNKMYTENHLEKIKEFLKLKDKELEWIDFKFVFPFVRKDGKEYIATLNSWTRESYSDGILISKSKDISISYEGKDKMTGKSFIKNRDGLQFALSIITKNNQKQK